ALAGTAAVAVQQARPPVDVPAAAAAGPSPAAVPVEVPTTADGMLALLATELPGGRYSHFRTSLGPDARPGHAFLVDYDGGRGAGTLSVALITAADEQPALSCAVPIRPLGAPVLSAVRPGGDTCEAVTRPDGSQVLTLATARAGADTLGGSTVAVQRPGGVLFVITALDGTAHAEGGRVEVRQSLDAPVLTPEQLEQVATDPQWQPTMPQEQIAEGALWRRLWAQP
ncbi:hypothetical protein, partial [Kitasatospora sp. MBT63]